MKKKGMTLIESVVTIALLGIIFLLATPLIRSFGGVSDRTKTQKEIDAEFLVVNEFLQKKIRRSKGVSTSGDGVELHLQIPVSSTTTDSVSFIFDDTNKTLKYSEDGGVSDDVLMENLDEVNFKVEKGIVIYFIDYNTGDYEETVDGDGVIVKKKRLRDSLRGSASSRIDIQ